MASVRRGCSPPRAIMCASLNSPGSSLVEAPALAAFLPDLATRLLGEKLALPSVPTVWLGDSAARASVLREHGTMVPPPGAGDGPAAGSVGDNGRAGSQGAAGPCGSGALALRGERDGDALGRSLLRRRRTCAAPRAGADVPGARPQRLARDAGRARLRAGRQCADLAKCRTGGGQGCLGPGRGPGRDRGTASGEHARRWRSDGPPATCPAVWPTTSSGSGATLSGLESAARLLRITHWPRQPARTDAARDGRTGRADRLSHPGRTAQRRGDRRSRTCWSRTGTDAGRGKLGLDPRLAWVRSPASLACCATR